MKSTLNTTGRLMSSSRAEWIRFDLMACFLFSIGIKLEFLKILSMESFSVLRQRRTQKNRGRCLEKSRVNFWRLIKLPTSQCSSSFFEEFLIENLVMSWLSFSVKCTSFSLKRKKNPRRMLLLMMMIGRVVFLFRSNLNIYRLSRPALSFATFPHELLAEPANFTRRVSVYTV